MRPFHSYLLGQEQRPGPRLVKPPLGGGRGASTELRWEWYTENGKKSMSLIGRQYNVIQFSSLKRTV